MENKHKHKTAFANNLRRIMQERGMSRRSLAEAIGLSYPAIAAYLSGDETGKGVLPSAEKAIQIAEILGVSLDELFGRSLPSVPETPVINDLSPAQKALRDLYHDKASLNLSVDLSDTDTVVLKSENRFVRLFFERIAAGAEVEATLGLFSGVILHNGELIDPITYQILMQRGEAND